VNGAVNKLQQKAAAARLVDQKDIFEAAKHGDFCLIMDHVIFNPDVVHQRDHRYVYISTRNITLIFSLELVLMSYF
jgi:hypothetical protein